MILIVKTHIGQEAVLTIEDPEGVAQKITSLSSQLANETLVPLQKRMERLASETGLEATTLRQQYLEQLNLLPGRMQSLAVGILEGYPNLVVSGEFLTPHEIRLTVNGCRYEAPSTQVH